MVTVTTPKPIARCSTCGLRKATIRSRCPHTRAVWCDGEIIGTVAYRPEPGDWKVTMVDNGINVWFTADTLVDVRHEISPAVLRLV